jgi:UDP-2,3-diacylglucosamine hydrolase
LTTDNKHIYFASDFHLGAPNYEESRIREDRIVRWLASIQASASEIYLVGDLFDFWFEYKKAIPKGFVRLQGKIAEICDSGISVHVFIGNHDMWMFDYLPQELGVIMHREPISKSFNGKQFLIGHGDGMGPGDNGYKFIKKVFANPICQWLFARLHPNLGIGMANYWSGLSRKANRGEEEKYLGDDNEFLVQYCKDHLTKEHVDYFIFGHRHLPLNMTVGKGSSYVNLGEWINYNSFGIWNGEEMKLVEFKG